MVVTGRPYNLYDEKLNLRLGQNLSNFGCGPDSFIEHFYKHIMGDKAYLILELDEHSTVAGVMTRLEAYKNVIENTMQKFRPDLKFDLKVAN